MKVFYHHGQPGERRPRLLDSEPNLLALSGNNWDDYGNKTTLNASLYFDGELLKFDFYIKVLIEGCDYTAKKLDDLRNNGWTGFFPIPQVNYISLPSNIEIYSILISKLGTNKTKKLLSELRDAGFLKHIKQRKKANILLNSKEFEGSLLRESGSIKAFEDGWRTIEKSSTEIKSFELNLLTQDGKTETIPYKFESSLLPYDINVLIGSNGIGKSYSIKSLVEYWLKTGIGKPELLEKQNHTPFNSPPNISKLILVSYSPFEEFTLDLEGNELQDKQAYKYFGFRYMNNDGSIGINRNLPSYNSANSILRAIYDDNEYDFIHGRVEKLLTVQQALKNAFQFDAIALELKDLSLFSDYGDSLIKVNGKHYLTVDKELPSEVSESELSEACKLETGVVFIKDKNLCSLSSGQRLFTYIVINVVGELKDNSLVVIDEPELFLHPTLEIEFIALLKAVLKPFKSKAILATHSLAVVREVPSRCVHIFRDEGYGLDIVSPPFETFGGDMQRISSYVFGDKSVTKPFDDWLEEKVKEFSSDELISLLDGQINEEMTMKILRLGRSNGH